MQRSLSGTLEVCFGTEHKQCVSPPSESIIRFSEIKYSVKEPQVAGEIAVVKIPVLRLGDTSKVSVVRVHTKDGSATSGEDYNPLSQGQQILIQLI